MVWLLVNDPNVDYLADSRVQNIATYADIAHEHGKRTVLIRIPMYAEVEDVVKYVDVAFNSEVSTIRMLNEAAARAGKVQDVVLMIDLGDLREGFFFENQELIDAAVEEILAMENVSLYGVAVNLTCYGAIIPKNDNLSKLVEIAKHIEDKFGVNLQMVSGGNSSSLYLIDKGELPEGINNLRPGDAFLLGNETAYITKVPGTCADAVTLEAQIVELKEKPSMPIGEMGLDAFGEKPEYEDKGLMQRAIIAIGKQDTDIGTMYSVDPQIEILGASSDHMLLDVTHCDKEYRVGDVVKFELGYGALLKLATSQYVDRTYVK